MAAGKTRSLIIDDEFASLIKMKLILSKYGECDTEMSAHKALLRFTESLTTPEPYTVVTFDINMPGVNGLELLQQFSDVEEKNDMTPSKKIVISSSGTQENVLIAARSSCDGFIVKPARREVVEDLLKKFGLNKLDR